MATNSDIKVTHNGITIGYSEDSGMWYAERDDRHFSDAQLRELKKKLDRATKVKIDRIGALMPYGGAGDVIDVEITSYNGHKPRISYMGRAGSLREETYMSSLYDATEANRAVFAELKPLREQINALKKQAYALEKKLVREKLEAHQRRTAALLRGEEPKETA